MDHRRGGGFLRNLKTAKNRNRAGMHFLAERKNAFREEARGRIFAGLKIGANMGIDVIIPVYRPDKKFDKLFAALS